MSGLAAKVFGRLSRRVVYRIFFPFFFIIILGVSIALPYGVRTTRRIMNERSNAEVLSAAGVVEQVIVRDLEKLLTFCELKIYSEPIQDSINRHDLIRLRQLIIPVRARSRVDLVIIFDREGNELLRLDEHRVLGEHLKDLAIVRHGLNGMAYEDVLLIADQMILCAIAPNETVGVPGGMNGAMLVGQVVDDQFVSDLKEITGDDVVISKPDGRIVASTWMKAFGGEADLDLEAVAARVTDVGEHLVRTYFIDGVPFRAAHQGFGIHREPRALISVISDMSAVYLSEKNVITVMILLMVSGVALAIFFSLVIARTISVPIERLVKATEAMAAGDLSQKITDIPPDEIGLLSESFNTMIGRIRRDIEEIQSARSKEQRYSRELEEINRELKKARGELIQASKMVAMGQLGAGVAHELNQPLLAIGLFAEQTLKQVKKGTPEYKNLERIIGQVNRMSEIVNEIRLFARQSLLEPHEVDVHVPLNRALGLVEKQLTDNNIKVELRLAGHLAPVMADDNQLQQVFLNIITNARDAMIPKKGGRLTVTSRSLGDGQFLSIDFTDTGVGIHREILSDIFMPFFTTKKEAKGIGLGLSISYGIIERHAGTIHVSSTEGEGSNFRVLLPTVLARPCWELVDCQECRPGGGEECPVYEKDHGYLCWVYHQKSGDEEQVNNRCRKCALYLRRHSFVTDVSLV